MLIVDCNASQFQVIMKSIKIQSWRDTYYIPRYLGRYGVLPASPTSKQPYITGISALARNPCIMRRGLKYGVKYGSLS